VANDIDNTVKSIAEATKSLSDTTRHGIDMTEKACAWLAKMMGEDAVGLLKDRVFYWRARNAIELQRRLDELLERRRIENPRAIPLRLAIPFLESATLEDDVTLQERWTRLLANAMDPNCEIYIERCFGTILEDLSPLACVVLEKIETIARDNDKVEITPQILAHDVGRDEKTTCVALGSLTRHGLVERRPKVGEGIGSISSWVFRNSAFYVTDLGWVFLRACSESADVTR